MSNVWSRMPHWSTLVQRWTEAMEHHGVDFEEGLTTVVDVVCEDLPEVRTVSGLRDMWIDRGSSLSDRPIPAFHLLSLESQKSRLHDANEVLRALGETGGDPELVAAVMIAATSVGYDDHDDSLQAAGRMATAILEAYAIDPPRQDRRPVFLMEDRFDLGGLASERLSDALAREHAGIFRSVIAARIRYLIKTVDGTRIPSREELAIGLPGEFDLAFGTRTQSVTSGSHDGAGKDTTRLALSSLPRDERIMILDAIMAGLAARGHDVDAVVRFDPERRSSSYFGSAIRATVDATPRNGWDLRVSRPTLITIKPDEADACKVFVGLDGSVRTEDIEALARLMERAVEAGKRIDAEGLRIDDWEHVDPRDLRVDSLTRRIAHLRDIDLIHDVRWRWGEEGKENPVPISEKDVRSIGLRVTDRRVHILRHWLPCPRDGALLFEDDGRTQTIRTPRAIGRDALDRPIAEVLDQPDLADIDDVIVDAITIDADGRSVLYLRSRPDPLPFPTNFEGRSETGMR
ncbi:hypothetical protein [Roseibium sp.]|uniref:hypothetical protein n=1 Tax=Roseibium sp. TaxID=1936156 RepID=UPI0032983935